MTKRREPTRREFLREAACGGAALALGLPLAAEAARKTSAKRTRVVLVRSAEALNDRGLPDEATVSRMLDDAVTALFETEDPRDAWSALLSPGDVLGVKTNVWGDLPTPQVLERALVRRARRVGIGTADISVRDRRLLDDPVFLRATALINVRPLRTHHWAGIGGCIKNYITFVRKPWKWHRDSCAKLGGLWHLPVCEGKTRLNVLVLLTPQFHSSGPHHFDPAYTWPYGGLLVGTDPVALDALGVRLLAEKRKRFFARPPRGGTSTKHVRLADRRHGIGTADLDRIDLVRIGWAEDSLI